MTTFARIHPKAKEVLMRFVDALEDPDQVPVTDEDEILADLVRAGGEIVLGIWEEMHRIGDELEHANVIADG